MSKDNKTLERVKRNTYRMLIIGFVVFLASSVGGVLLGQFFDSRYDIAPWGTYGMLGVMYIFSWIVVLLFLKNINKEITLEREGEK